MRRIVLTPSSRDLPESLTPSAWQDALELAAGAWNGRCGVELDVAPAVPLSRAREDGVNLLVFRGDEWCHNERCGPGTTFPLRAVAMTTKYPEGGGEVREADVELQARVFGPAPPKLFESEPPSLQVALVHELGHVLGLKDACVAGHLASGTPKLGACSAEARDSVLFAPARLDAPTARDIAELCRTYPLAEAPAPAVVPLDDDAAGSGLNFFVLAVIGVAAFAAAGVVRFRAARRARSSS